MSQKSAGPMGREELAGQWDGTKALLLSAPAAMPKDQAREGWGEPEGSVGSGWEEPGVLDAGFLFPVLLQVFLVPVFILPSF